MSKVYFWNLRTTRKSPHALKMKKLLKQSGLNAIIDPGNLVALKVHFGESGNTGYLNALNLRPIVDFLKKQVQNLSLPTPVLCMLVIAVSLFRMAYLQPDMDMTRI